MTYDEDINKWRDNNIITDEKTDMYVICKTKMINAITVVDILDVPFTKIICFIFHSSNL